MKQPITKFDTIAEFKSFCSANNISPMINTIGQKHKNRRDQHLHEVSGSFNFNSMDFKFTIDETTAFDDKSDRMLVSLNTL